MKYIFKREFFVFFFTLVFKNEYADNSTSVAIAFSNSSRFLKAAEKSAQPPN